jgi:hypothetical protein
MQRHPSSRTPVLAGAAVALAGALGLVASALVGAGALAVAGSSLFVLVGAGVLLGHGFDAAFDAWPRSWMAVPALLVASGLLGLADAAGVFGSVELLGLPVSVGLVVVGVALLARWGDRLPAHGTVGPRPGDADRGQ